MVLPPLLKKIHFSNHAALPVALVILVAIGGLLLLNKADAQARDTIRKHHLDDVEHALYHGFNTRHTFPPYNETTWCGFLSAPGNEEVRAQVEEVLREDNEKYANPAKPFPVDPLRLKGDESWPHYFYIKHSPASFTLASELESDTTGTPASSIDCANDTTHTFNYSLRSTERQFVNQPL